MKSLFALFVIGCATPLAAQAAAPTIIALPAEAPQPPAVAAQPIDPARLKTAGQIIDLIWPSGMFRKLMDGTMSTIAQNASTGSLDVPIETIVGEAARDSGIPPGTTLREIMAKVDPYFEERTRLRTNAMMEGLATILSESEPEIRTSMTEVYARHFTETELTDVLAFFESTSGRKYASEMLLLAQDPKVLEVMQSFTPRLLKAMPEILKKAEAATAHLPPPPDASKLQEAIKRGDFRT